MPVARLLSSIPTGHPVLAGASAERCSAGQRIEHDGIELHVLHPTIDDYAVARSTNAMSCVVELQLGPVRLLLTGDIPAAEEPAMLARGPPLAVTWLAAPHHGSRSSSTDALLDATQRHWVAVQAGYRNRFGHPDASVVERYRRRGIALERTDYSGALQWRLGAAGETPVIRRRSESARYWHNRPGAAAPGTLEAGDDEPGARSAVEPPVEPFTAN